MINSAVSLTNIRYPVSDGDIYKKKTLKIRGKGIKHCNKPLIIQDLDKKTQNKTTKLIVHGFLHDL